MALDVDVVSVADVEAHNLVFSWCSVNHVKIRTADISNAYLQGKPMDRVVLYRIPRGGIPECGIYEGDVIAARVPIYGTKDSGRGWWLELRDQLIHAGYVLNQILPALFSLRNYEGKMIGIMSTNVDDLLYGCLDEGEPYIRAVLDKFPFGKEESGEFRFCGKEVKQRAVICIICLSDYNKLEQSPHMFNGISIGSNVDIFDWILIGRNRETA